ncbi:MAG TPA: polysaccharide deacetylase family protein [Acidimicrobiales bacterium]|nr:polysaccharide deacetylase family protein [Acidimicrobiales bacterium]
MRSPGRAAVGLSAAALAAQYLPSVVTLGQWTALRALPGGLCRWRGPVVGKVALTFDDGPSPEATPAFLDELEALGLPGTFFCLGEHVRRHPDLVAEIRRRGHQVELHGQRHSHHLARSPRWVDRDLGQAVDSLRSCGVTPRWYRPSYGQATGSTLLFARRHGLRTVLWSAWGKEWTTDDPTAVADRVAGGLGPGAIVLLHDDDTFGRPGMWRTGLAALPLIAAELRRRQLEAVTFDRLMGSDAAPAGPVANGAVSRPGPGGT